MCIRDRNKGNIDITYEYKPELCQIRAATAAMPFWKVSKSGNVVTNPQIILGRKYPWPTFMNATFAQNTNNDNTMKFNDFKVLQTYAEPGRDLNITDMHIEMAGLVSRGMGELSSAFLPPTLHIAGLPVDSQR